MQLATHASDFRQHCTDNAAQIQIQIQIQNTWDTGRKRRRRRAPRGTHSQLSDESPVSAPLSIDEIMLLFRDLCAPCRNVSRVQPTTRSPSTQVRFAPGGQAGATISHHTTQIAIRARNSQHLQGNSTKKRIHKPSAAPHALQRDTPPLSYAAAHTERQVSKVHKTLHSQSMTTGSCAGPCERGTERFTRNAETTIMCHVDARAARWGRYRAPGHTCTNIS